MECNKILFIDDEESILKLIGKMLKRKGFEVETAKEGNEAIKHLNENSYDLIITDYTLPDIEFHNLLHQINLNGKKNKIILTSGYNTESLLSKNDKEQIDGFIAKPFRINQLLDLIEKI